LRALRWAHELPDPGCELAALAKSSLERLKRKTRRHAAWRDAKERHALRIQVKRLRYACEFFGVPDPAAEKLQDLLGELNDIAVGRRLLGELGGSPQIKAALKRREQSLLRRLEPAWNAFAKKT